MIFNYDELFEIAERIEKNGAAFYRKAAGLHEESPIRVFLLNLADMEDEHLRIFAGMRQEFSSQNTDAPVYDPNGEQALYLNAIADSHGGEGSKSAADSLTGKETLDKILRIALDLEYKSILFYTGMKDLVPPRFGTKKVEKIIEEEKKHVAIISQKIIELQPGR